MMMIVYSFTIDQPKSTIDQPKSETKGGGFLKLEFNLQCIYAVSFRKQCA